MSTTTILLLLGGALLLIGVVIAVVIAVRKRPEETTSIEDRLAEYSERDAPVTLEELELSASFADRVIYPTIDALSKFVSQFTPEKVMENIQHKLELAENPGNLTPANFLAIRFVAMFVLGGLIFVLMIIAKLPVSRRILFTVVVTALGYFLPVIWLGSKIRHRQGEIVKQLPDTLDLLTICVEAGLGFDQGVQKVVEKQDNELGRSFNRYLQEVRLGKPRREGLQNMSNRAEVPDVTSFIAAIIQADQLGVSMAKILRIQSDQMRIRRRQRAEQKAHQAPIKMLFPMVFLIFPSIFIILLGPAILLLMESGTMGTIF
jgi:tight adherence protein C